MGRIKTIWIFIVILFVPFIVHAQRISSPTIFTLNNSEFHYETYITGAPWKENTEHTIEVRLIVDKFGPNVVKFTNIRLYLYFDFFNGRDYGKEIPDAELGSIDSSGGWFIFYFKLKLPDANTFSTDFKVKSEFYEVLTSGSNEYYQGVYVKVGSVGIIDSSKNTQFDSQSKNSPISLFYVILGGIVILFSRKSGLIDFIKVV